MMSPCTYYDALQCDLKKRLDFAFNLLYAWVLYVFLYVGVLQPKYGQTGD
jgi:hypothetical protein